MSYILGKYDETFTSSDCKSFRHKIRRKEFGRHGILVDPSKCLKTTDQGWTLSTSRQTPPPYHDQKPFFVDPLRLRGGPSSLRFRSRTVVESLCPHYSKSKNCTSSTTFHRFFVSTLNSVLDDRVRSRETKKIQMSVEIKVPCSFDPQESLRLDFIGRYLRISWREISVGRGRAEEGLFVDVSGGLTRLSQVFVLGRLVVDSPPLYHPFSRYGPRW